MKKNARLLQVRDERRLRADHAGPGTLPGNAITNNVSALLDETLAPQTVYHFKVVASNGKGTSEGLDETFETLPAVAGVSTDPATNIKTMTADLNGSFTGDGLNVRYYFESNT